MAKMFKVEMYVIPLNLKDECIKQPSDMVDTIENDDLRDDCILKFGEVVMVDIGEFEDDSKFNQNGCSITEFRKEFT